LELLINEGIINNISSGSPELVTFVIGQAIVDVNFRIG